MNLTELQRSITDMNEDELLALIVGIRAERREASEQRRVSGRRKGKREKKGEKLEITKEMAQEILDSLGE